MNENKEEVWPPCVSNTFLFDEEAYKDIFEFSPGNKKSGISRFLPGSLVLYLAFSSLSLSVFSVFIFFQDLYLMDSFKPITLLFLLPLVLSILLFVLGLGMMRGKYRRVKWNKPDTQATMQRDFVCVKLGRPLVFNTPSYALTNNVGLENAASVYTDPAWSTPNEIEFNAWIRDDGVYVGRSGRQVVWDYRTDINETFESLRYFGLALRTSECIVFDKAAFVGADYRKVKEYVQARMGFRDVRLADYMDI